MLFARGKAMTMLKTYGEFRPTAFDSHINIDDYDEPREGWLVAPVSQTRDSERLERSNFRVVLADLDRDADGTVEVHSFGHWGHGWFEIILCKPGTKAAYVAQEWEDKLNNYPVASDDDYSNLEAQEVSAEWDRMSLSGRVREIRNRDYPCSVFAARRDEVPERLWEYLAREH